jgi:hypothetical protein
VTENLLVALDRHLQVKNAAMASIRLPNVNRAEWRLGKRAERLIGILNLEAFRDKFVRELSTGTRRLGETWAFHWHNIPARLFVHVLTHVPAEAYVAVTGDAGGAIALYGFLFFAAPLLGLALTYAADRSEGRTIFTVACLSTACVCPLVFGCPTEMWIAHSAFWPAVALAHCARRDALGAAAVLLAMLALALSHEGGLVLAASIAVPLLVKSPRSLSFLRAAGAFLAALAVWAAVKVLVPPDAYYAAIIGRAAMLFIDVAALAQPALLAPAAAVAAHLMLVAALKGVAPGRANVVSGSMVAAGLTVYWVWLDTSLHAESRYAFRTALFIGTGLLGVLAGVLAKSTEQPGGPLPASLVSLQALMARLIPWRAAAGAIVLISLAHAVETAKYVSAWTDYKAAVRALAMGSAADPQLGNAGLVSAGRIDERLNPLSWFSTTPYLSVLVAPGHRPRRLVVHPDGGYYWLACATAAASLARPRALPQESRRLVRVFSCLHRP